MATRPTPLLCWFDFTEQSPKTGRVSPNFDCEKYHKNVILSMFSIKKQAFGLFFS